jgi:hypothetical protein
MVNYYFAHFSLSTFSLSYLQQFGVGESFQHTRPHCKQLTLDLQMFIKTGKDKGGIRNFTR